MKKFLLASYASLFFFCTATTGQNCAPKGHMFVQWTAGVPAGTNVFSVYENILAGRQTAGGTTHANASAYTQAWGGQLPNGGNWTWTVSRGGELNYAVDDSGNAQQLCAPLKTGVDIAIYSLPINGWYPVMKRGTNYCANAGRSNWCPSAPTVIVAPKIADPDGCITCNPCLIVSASVQTVQIGQSFTISWNADCGASTLCVDGTTIALSGTATRTATAPGQQCFQFVACCATGESVTRQVCVNVVAPLPPPVVPVAPCVACEPKVSCNAGWTSNGYNLETKNVSKIIFEGKEYSFNQTCGSTSEIIFLPASQQAQQISFTVVDNCGNQVPYVNKVLVCPGCGTSQGRMVQSGGPVRGGLRMMSHDIRGGSEFTGYYGRQNGGGYYNGGSGYYNGPASVNTNPQLGGNGLNPASGPVSTNTYPTNGNGGAWTPASGPANPNPTTGNWPAPNGPVSTNGNPR